MQGIQEMWVSSLGQEESLEKEMATYSSILAWKIPRTEEPGGLQSMGLQRVGHDWKHTHTHTHGHLINLQQQCLSLSCLEGEAETWKPLDRMWWVNLTFRIQRGVFELRWWKASALAWDTNWKYFCRTLQSLQARFPFYSTFVKKQKFLFVVFVNWFDLISRTLLLFFIS